MIYDLIITGIVGAMFASLYGAAYLIVYKRPRFTKGNPFRKLKDWQIGQIIR